MKHSTSVCIPFNRGQLSDSQVKQFIAIWVSDDLTSEESEGDQSHEFLDAVPIDGDRQD